MRWLTLLPRIRKSASHISHALPLPSATVVFLASATPTNCLRNYNRQRPSDKRHSKLQYSEYGWMLVIPMCLPNTHKYKICQNTPIFFIIQLLPQSYMFRLPRVIIRSSMEPIQDYLSSSCTLGSLTKGGMYKCYKTHVMVVILYIK